MPAREVHVCGNESAVELVQRLASLMNEQVEVSEHEVVIGLHFPVENFHHPEPATFLSKI